MMPGTHQNWQSMGAGGLYGGNTMGSGSGMPIARTELDGIRMGTGRVPQAEYPDGYLGSIRSRRDDRLLDSTKSRANQRSYQRGVHKGERIDPSDYIWPESLQPDRGLRNQARGIKTTFVEGMQPAEPLVNDGKETVAVQPMEMDARRREALGRMLPKWR
jgi:hypothetical protein